MSRSSMRIFGGALSLLLAIALGAGCAQGQIPFGFEGSMPDEINTQPPSEDGSQPAGGQPAPGDDGGTVGGGGSTGGSGDQEPGPEKGAFIASCNGIMTSPPYLDSADLVILPGEQVLASCDTQPVPGIEIPNALIEQAVEKEWFGAQVIHVINDHQLLVNNYNTAGLPHRQTYSVYDYDGTSLLPVGDLASKHSFFPYLGSKITVLEDVTGDGFEDFIAITADANTPPQTYYMEVFPGTEQGLSLTSSGAVPVSNDAISEPVYLAASQAGYISTAYSMFDPILKISTLMISTYDWPKQQEVGIRSFRKEMPCGLEIVRIPDHMSLTGYADKLAVCIKASSVTAQIYLRNFTPSPLPKVLEIPAMVLSSIPTRLQELERNLLVLTQGHAAAFDGATLAKMSQAQDPWDQAALSWKVDALDFPQELMQADFNADGELETLILTTITYSPSEASFKQKIFLNEDDAPCRVLTYESCEYPQTG